MKRLFDRRLPAEGEEVGKNPIFWGVLLFSMLLKYGYYGFTYFPMVDDNNMYGVFSMMSPLDALLKYKMYTTRPLAVFLDTFVISRLWGHLWIMLLIFTLLHFISSYLVYKVFEKNSIRTGIVLAVIFALFPLGNDASYWIAASSRIVAGLFFAVLSFYLYMQYIEKSNEGGHRTYLYVAGFAIANLISLGFYEQVIAFSFVGILLLIAVNFKRQKNKLITIIPFANIAILAAYYISFSSSGNMASRGQLLRSDYIQHTINVYRRIKELMTVIPAKLIKHGVINGVQLILTDRAVFFVLLALLVSVALGFLYSREKVTDSWKSCTIKFFIGLFLIFLPFAPFFILQTIWIVHRNTFISLIGVGIIVEGLAGIFFMKWDLRILRGIAAGAVIFVFLLGNVAELNDYRNISRIDNEIAANLSGALEDAQGKDWYSHEVIVFNTRPIYITPTSRHFSNSTGSDWALTGALSSILRQRSIKMLYPVVDGQKALINVEKLKKCILVGMDTERHAFPLVGEWKSDSLLELRLENGEIFGNVNITGGGEFTFEAAFSFKSQI